MSSQVDRKRGWSKIASVLRKGAPRPNWRVAVLAAHPDDETIGASLLLSRFPQSKVVFLTDGAPEDRRLWPAGVNGSRRDYAEIRRREATRALAHAGLREGSVCWLGGVDQESAFEIVGLAGQFAQWLSAIRPAIVVTHPYEGGHPDHDVAAVVARLALSRLDKRRAPVLLEMTSYHSRDGHSVTGEFLPVGSCPELSFEFSSADRERKRAMMEAYASQRIVLQGFSIDRERLRPAPQYDFAQSPHPGPLGYEVMGWPMSGVRWRELATAAMAHFEEYTCG
jgi:N-acetylglucosamine malate deacetylase 2